jgi:hypothetical protein
MTKHYSFFSSFINIFYLLILFISLLNTITDFDKANRAVEIKHVLLTFTKMGFWYHLEVFQLIGAKFAKE